jgi:hypothetical protein
MKKGDRVLTHRVEKPNRAGAKGKLTPEVQDKIVKALRAGNYRTTAAKVAGIHDATFYNWIKWGEAQKKGRYFEFFEAVKKAEAEGEAALIATINVASKDTWQAAAWILERKYPDRWGRKDALAMSGTLEHSGEVKHDVTKTLELTPELRRIAARFTAAYYRVLRGGKEQLRPGDAE